MPVRCALEYDNRPHRVGPVLIAWLCLAVVACAQRVDFGKLRTADRIDVRTASDKSVKEIVEPKKIKAAVEFIVDHREGWRESPSGPLAPDLMLQFYRGPERLGGFGVTRRHLVADPSTRGWLSRSVSVDEVNDLLQQLDVKLP
jgi:hypothetical protein